MLFREAAREIKSLLDAEGVGSMPLGIDVVEPPMMLELQKLGIEVAQATVAKYLRRRRGPPSQSWRTFLSNHASQLASIDFVTVPTATSSS